MKIKTLLFPLFILSAVLFVSCSDSTSADDEPEIVHIPDTRLETQIRLSLGVDETIEITADLMHQLEELNIDGSDDFAGELTGISDLTGLEYAVNLEHLRLSYTSVTDLSPISGLENIEYLRINNTSITDISALSNYTRITYFNANTVTGLEDISPLAGNTDLRTAILREVPMGNEGMETIRNFTTIHRINMRDTGVTDITVLGELMEQGALLDSTPFAQEENGGAVLDLRGLSIEDWSPIEPYLDQVSDISGYPN